MAETFCKLLRRGPASQPASHPADEDADLLQFFTGCEDACRTFESLATGSDPQKRLLIIHGVGGTGKSSLLKMYRHICSRKGIPCATARGEEALSPASILADWADGLKADGISLPTFEKTLKQYRSLQSKMEAE